MSESTLTIFPNSEYAELSDTIFAFLLSEEQGGTIEPRVVFDPDILDGEEAEELAYEIIDLLQKRDILTPIDPILH